MSVDDVLMKITLGELRVLIREAGPGQDQAIERLWALPDSDELPEEDTKQNPLRLASPDDEDAGAEALAQTLGKWSSLAIEDVDVFALTTNQGFISANAVQSIIMGGAATTHTDPRSWQGSDLPIVFRRISGKLVLMDGNHRVVADMLRGRTKVRARILEERQSSDR